MGCAFRLDRWDGQFTVLLIGAREFLGVEQRCDAGATWQGAIGPAGIKTEFRQQSSRPPAWMRPAHLHDGIAHARRKRAQRSSSGAAHLGVETAAPLMVPTAAPFAHRPD